MKLPSARVLVLGCFLGLLFLYVGAVFTYQYVYAGRLLPGVSIAGVDVGGKTQTEATLLVRQTLAPIFEQATFSLEFPEPKQDTGVPLSSLLGFQDAVGADAYRVGRSPGTALWYAPFLLPFAPHNIPQQDALFLKQDGLRAFVEKSSASIEAADASFGYDRNPITGAFTASILPERAGIEIDLDATMRGVSEALRAGQARAQAVIGEETSPRRRASDLEPLLAEANRWLSAPITLTRDTETLTLSPTMIGDLFTVTSTIPDLALVFDQEKLTQFFDGHPFTATTAPQNGWIKLTPSSTVADLKIPTRGQVVDIPSTKANLETAAAKTGDRRATLEVQTSYGVFEGQEAERLGVRDLLGRGDSNFSGSPTNRRKNIAIGAERLHATLVGPGETFSTMKTLGPITGEAGWLPELVIKGNQTLPEFGGGLCQIGTTAFRAALKAGMPITERRNHSYRVRYYEPAGTDATLYDPAPDFKFKNDSAHHILITKDLRKDDVSFLIWGTSDGRIASTTTPLVTNIIQPPPKKTIETTDLKPGEVKCTESAHAGATASFNYSVLYADGRQATSTFRSVYRPWQAVCLVGVEKLSTPEAPVNGPDETGLNSPG